MTKKEIADRACRIMYGKPASHCSIAELERIISIMEKLSSTRTFKSRVDMSGNLIRK